MRARAMLLIFLASSCGMAASIAVSAIFDPRAPEPVVGPRDRIYVARRVIEPGQRLTQDLIKIELWFHDNVPPNAVRHVDDLEEKCVTRRLAPGEPILVSQLGSPSEVQLEQADAKWAHETPVNKDDETGAATTERVAAENSAKPEVVEPEAPVPPSPAPPVEPTTPTPLVTNETPSAGPANADADDRFWVMTVHTPQRVKVVKWRRTSESSFAANPEWKVTDLNAPRRDEGRSLRDNGAPSDASSAIAGLAFDERAYRGHAVVVVFWDFSSPRTKDELMAMHRLCDRYQGERVELVSVCVDSDRARAASFLSDLGLRSVASHAMAAQDATARFGVRQFPAVLVFDEDGHRLGLPQRGVDAVSVLSRHLLGRDDDAQLSSRPVDSRR